MARKKRTTTSPNYKEYMRLRRNIIARMKYREKQGFKVDYTTKPQIMQRPTKRDIERLGKYKVGMNKYGEVIADKPRSKAIERTNFRGVTPSSVYNQTTTPDTTHYTVQQVDVDWEGMIWAKINTLRNYYFDLPVGELFGHDIGGDLLIAIMDAYGQIYSDLCDAMYDNEQEFTLYERNEYYKRRWDEISSEFAKLVETPPSDDDKIREIGERLVDIIKMS